MQSLCSKHLDLLQKDQLSLVSIYSKLHDHDTKKQGNCVVGKDLLLGLSKSSSHYRPIM